MMKTCKLCWGANVLLIGVVAFAAYTLILGKPAEIAEDGRTSIKMTAAEKGFVLGEMRGFLETVQAITADAAENNLKGVAETALAAGMGSTGGEPVTLIAKLPLEFKSLGMSTHQAFDDLAATATDTGDMDAVLGSLSDLMLNCTSCHASYRFDTDESGS